MMILDSHVRRRRNMLICTASLMAAAACTMKTHGTDSAEKAAEQSMTPEQRAIFEDYRMEVEVGRNMAGRLLGYYGVVEDPKLVGYVNQIGSYVASYGDYPERRYMFAVLKHESVNAFACPGGYILVTMGALRNANSEAELAAVLGHEVAHVGKRHMYDALKKMKQKDIDEASAKKRAAIDKDPYLKMRQRPETDSASAAGSRLATYLTGKAGVGLSIMAAAAAGMQMITEKGLDKDLEYEADQEGVKYAIRAGYEPRAMMAFLKRLEDHSAKKVKNLEKTHPPMKERRDQLAKVLLSLKAEDIIGADGQERFKKVKAIFPVPEAG
ncbi:MAG: hypothetical protein FJ146_11295 [Deltaproteobacteria bacterium]|nr:hypothetical protein [Deltaproteobacteria bacterium]